MTRSSSKTSAETAIRYNGETIAFALVRTKTKRLTISVCPNLAVEVKAPKDRSLTQIKARVENRAARIARQLQHFRQAPPAAPKRRYVSGETHVFLGRQYRLKIHPADHSSVKLIGRYLHVLTPTPYRVGELVEDWYPGPRQATASSTRSAVLRRCEAIRYPFTDKSVETNVQALG